jgi:hypothetical protein
MKLAFGWLAFAGLLLSIAVHVLAALGVDVEEHVPMLWMLHIGVFVVILPAVLELRHPTEGKDNASFHRFLRGLPSWARAFAIALSAYVVLNFIPTFVASFDGLPKASGNQYVLEHKGKFVRELTPAEFHSRRAQVARGFSGHWLAFYFFSFAILVLRKDVRRTAERGSVPTSHQR